MTGTPEETGAAVDERDQDRHGTVVVPDGLLPPVLWGTGLLTSAPRPERDRTAKSRKR